MTLNPTAVAPNPRYRGAKPRERELEIEARAKERRSRWARGDIPYIRRREKWKRERKIETPPSRESTVPEINTPASCDHSSCHAPLLSPHISRLSRSLSFIPFSPSFSVFPSRTFSLSFSRSISPFLTLRVPRDLHPSGSGTPHSRGRRHLAPNRGA